MQVGVPADIARALPMKILKGNFKSSLTVFAKVYKW